MADEFLFVGDGLKGLARDLEKAAGALARESAPLLERIGKEVEENAKRIAANNGSTSIPGTIRGGLRGPYEYRIQAGGGDNEIAALWELGNRGSRLNTETFWHWTFGNPPKQQQKRYPFLRPALAENRAEITRRMNAMWDVVLGPYRLRPSMLGTEGSSSIPTAAEPGLMKAEYSGLPSGWVGDIQAEFAPTTIEPSLPIDTLGFGGGDIPDTTTPA